MKIATSLLDLIGKTPLVRLSSIMQKTPGCVADVVGKLEYMNPASSVKDRLALAMVNDAETQGFLQPFSSPPNVIVEPTSGNTGIGLAMVAAIRGYRLIITMPEGMSIERRKLIKALGAEVILTPAARGMAGAVEKAQEIVASTESSFMLQQFSNPSGPVMHEKSTAQEIWQDCDGQVDVVVGGIGTGGTVTGLAHGLKAHNPAIKVFGVEPDESAVLSGEQAGVHMIQGIGAGFVPEVLDAAALDGILRVTSEDAIAMSKRMMKEEGILAGIASGAAAHAAFSLAVKPEYKGKRIVFIITDTCDRYLSTELFF